MTKRIKFYQGEIDGARWQSIHPRLYRARYKRRINGRDINIDKMTSGMSEDNVRYDLIYHDPHGDIRGDITVEFVKDLEPVYTEE